MRRSEEQGAERKRSRWYLYSTLPLLRRYFGVRCDSVGTLCRVGTSRFLLALSARLHTTTPIHPGIRALLARSGRGEFRPGPSAENAPETAKRNSTSRIYQRGAASFDRNPQSVCGLRHLWSPLARIHAGPHTLFCLFAFAFYLELAEAGTSTSRFGCQSGTTGDPRGAGLSIIQRDDRIINSPPYDGASLGCSFSK
jgi:hypothetical protein